MFDVKHCFGQILQHFISIYNMHVNYYSNSFLTMVLYIGAVIPKFVSICRDFGVCELIVLDATSILGMLQPPY